MEHVQRTDSEYIDRRMLNLELPGKIVRRRPKRRFMGAMKEYMKVAGVVVEDEEDRVR